MTDLKLPANPTNFYNSEGGANGYAHGFTKLEMAVLMIAHGLSNRPEYYKTEEIASFSVTIAKAVLEEANK